MKKPGKVTIEVQGADISILSAPDGDFISLTDRPKAKDGDFFISDCFKNRNRESVYSPHFNSGEFPTMKSQAGLNRIHSDAIKSKLFLLRLSAFICG